MYIRRCIVDTAGAFDTNQHKYNSLRKIQNCDVYWSDDGTLVLVTTRSWKNHLLEITDPCEEESPFNEVVLTAHNREDLLRLLSE